MRKQVAKLIREAVTITTELEGQDLKRAIRTTYKAWNNTPRHRIEGVKDSPAEDFVADRHRFRLKLEEIIKNDKAA